MIKVLKKENMGSSNLGWLESRFHFSFAQYRNPDNIKFGNLRVLNDDIIHPNSGFDTHPHENMEIISYIIDGYLTHKDSMGNEETLSRGHVQYLSAGNGIAHSEYNKHETLDTRLLQIWIYPPKNGLPKLYGSHKFTVSQREDKILSIVSSKDGDAPIKIYQDVNINVCEMKSIDQISINLEENRQIYFVLIEGEVEVNKRVLEFGDACQIQDESEIKIQSNSKSHFLYIEMEKEN
jgi:redox-sensitive bicupin YhaK (pirin superfamily)